jgi:two-component system response regulator FixJ
MPKTLNERATVVIAEGDAGLRDALSFALEIEGYTVVSCASALTLLGMRLPTSRGCLVADQDLPEMGGISTLEVLRGRHVDLPAIVIAGAPNADLRARALMANARVLETPLLNGLLAGAIRDLI